jgi:hypothetical protein
VLGNGCNVAVVQLSKARTIQVPDVAVQFSGKGCKNSSLHGGLQNRGYGFAIINDEQLLGTSRTAGNHFENVDQWGYYTSINTVPVAFISSIASLIF